MILHVQFGWRPVGRVRVPWLYCICVFLRVAGRLYLPFLVFDFLWFVFVSMALGVWCRQKCVYNMPVRVYIYFTDAD